MNPASKLPPKSPTPIGATLRVPEAEDPPVVIAVGGVLEVVPALDVLVL